MGDAANPTRPAAPRRRWTRLRILFYTFLLLLSAACLAYTHFTDSARVAKIASDTLARMTGADVRIGGAAFELNGVIRLFDIELRIPDVPGKPEGGDRLFTADQVLIHHNIWSLTTGHLDVRSVSLIRPTFFPTEDVDERKFTFQYLKPQSKPKKKDKSRSVDLPDVHLSQALIVFGEIENGRYHALQTTQLNGDLTRQPKETGIYSFALRQARGERPFVLSGDFDLYSETMTARMQLGPLGHDDPRIDMLPRQIRTLFQTIRPQGNFPVIQFGYDKERQFNALVEIEGGGLIFPWGETALHIEQSKGTVAIEHNNRLSVDLRGKARGVNYGADYEIQGAIDGFEDEAGFDLTARLHGEIPEKLDDLHLFPSAVRSIIERVSPQGGYDVTVNIRRDPASGEILTHGKARVIDGAVNYSLFAYPLSNLDGEITFDNERIDIGPITGIGPKDALGRQAKVTINGHVIGTGRRPGVHVSVSAKGAPVDHHLRAALDPKDEQQIYDMFLSPEQLKPLLDEQTGYLQTSEQRRVRMTQLEALRQRRTELLAASPRDDEALKKLDDEVATLTKLSGRPVFDLGGIADAQVDIRTIPGERWQYLTIRAKAPGLNIAYENWPYPLTVDDGELQINIPAIDGEVVRVVGHARSLTGAKVEVNGVMRPPLERRQPLVPDLHLSATQLPIDAALLASIPPKDRTIVERLAVQGAVDVKGHIFNDADHRLDFGIDVSMREGKAQPNHGRYPLTDVAADLRIHRRGVELRKVSARHDDSQLSLVGVPAQNGSPASITIHGKDVRFGEELLDLIPGEEKAVQQVRALLNEYKPQGVFDFTLSELEQREDATHYRFVMKPGDMSLMLHDQRIELAKMDGQVTVTPRQVQFDTLRGDFGTGRFRLDGTITTGSRPTYALGFDIASEGYCRVTQSLLPGGAAEAIRSLKLDGAYRIRDAKLVIDPGADDRPQMRFDATVRLDDASAVVGVPVTRMTGDIRISLSEQKLGEAPALELAMDRVRLRAADRWVDPLSVRITSGEKPGHYDIARLRGEVYGGTVTGKGALFRQEGKDHYKMELALQEVALEPFIHPNDPAHQPAESPGPQDIRLIGDLPAEGDAPERTEPRKEPVVRQKTGLLSASLAIEGSVGDADAKRGRGDLRIRDAALYETQIGIALLQILNLSAPASRAFDKVEAGYIIDGDTVHLDRINFEAPTLTIAGKGTMKYSTLALDLTMTSANPRGIELGPLTDVLKLLKDELISIRVTGTLTQPKAGVQSLKGITGAVDEVLGKPKEPRRIVPPSKE